MGRTFLKFDPAGYKDVEEPGVDWEYRADNIYKVITGTDAGQPTANHTIENPDAFHFPILPPASGWLLPQHRQANAQWEQDARLSDHVVTLSHWTIMGGATARETEWGTKTGSGSAALANKGIVVGSLPASISSLLIKDLQAMVQGTTYKVATGTGIIAVASTGPNATSLNTVGAPTPQFSFSLEPAPNDTFIFGFSNIACICQNGSIGVFRTSDSGSTWEMLRNRSAGAPTQQLGGSNTGGLQPGSGSFFKQDYQVTILMVGPSSYWVYRGAQPLFEIPLADPRKLANTDNPSSQGDLFPAGPWWVAGAPHQRVAWQAQMVGYEEFVTTGIRDKDGKPLKWFDLGTDYNPTLDPVLTFQTVTHGPTPATQTGGTSLPTSKGFTFTSDVGEKIEVAALNSAATGDFPADGTQSQGALHVRLHPSNSGHNAGLYAPQLRVIDLQFPAKLRDRRNPGELTLDDTEFDAWSVEASWIETLGKRLRVRFREIGLRRFQDAGLHLRSDYPMELWEDADEDGEIDTLRARAWVRHAERVTTVAENEDGGPPQFVDWDLEAVGMLERANQGFLVLPQILDPSSNGTVEHTYAVRQTLKAFGIDIADTDAVQIATDPWDGTDISRLPGTWALAPGSLLQQLNSPQAPGWDETGVAYCERLAKTFRGWALFEDLSGKIWYCPDPIFDGDTLKTPYQRSGTIYRSTTEAQSGDGDPRQAYQQGARFTVGQCQGNSVRVCGKDVDGSNLPHIIDRDTGSIGATEADEANEYFLGGRKVCTPLIDRMIVGDKVARNLARIYLTRAKRIPKEAVLEIWGPAPWEMAPGTFDAGWIVAVQGWDPADWLIQHMQVDIIRRDYYHTRLALQSMPKAAPGADWSGAGPYPGAQG